jgi:hypothetical protein
MKTNQNELKKHRNHFILFCKDTPFKPKQVKLKTLYTRKDKHKSQESC